MKQLPKHIKIQLDEVNKIEQSHNRKNTGCLRPALVAGMIVYVVATAIYNLLN